MNEALFEIVTEPIQAVHVIEKVSRSKAGAITTFMGTVREWTKGKRTLYLEYQAYIPMALKQLATIGAEVKSKWPETKIAITHRVGRLNIEELAVVIAVSAPHRKTAYEANEYAIERIKKIVPIWKKEHYTDGEMWIGNQPETIAFPERKPSLEKEDI